MNTGEEEVALPQEHYSLHIRKRLEHSEQNGGEQSGIE